VIRYEGDPGQPGLDSLNPATALPYDGVSHRYEDTFTATRSARLEAFVKPLSAGPSFQGGFSLELYGPAPPAVPPPPAPKPQTGGPADLIGILPDATGWGQSGPATVLAPGDRVVRTSPPIERGQREVGVTLTPAEQADAADFIISTGTLLLPRKRKKPPSSNRITTRGDCIRAAVGVTRAFIRNRIRRGEQLGIENDDERVIKKHWEGFSFFLAIQVMACLDHVKDLERQAQTQQARTSAAGAARPSCGLATQSLSARIDRGARALRWRTRGAARRQPARLLRVSCRAGKYGAMAISIRTRSRRIKLRKVLGPRLIVGVYRSSSATGTAKIWTTFNQ
jgi:hypothetical protein